MQRNKAVQASHIVIAALIVGVMLLKLAAGAIAGFLVYSMSRRVKCALERRFPTLHARGVALALVIAAVALVVFAGIVGLWQLAKGQHGISGLSAMLVDVLGRMHGTVPTWLDHYLPASIDDARGVALNMLRKYGEQLSAVGMGTLKGAAHVLVGLIAGAMLAWNEFAPVKEYRPLSAALLERFGGLGDAFERVVFAQVKISLLNTVLSALYLLVALPAAGVHVPFSKTLVVFTFFAGLLPVVGNLISNSAVVLASLGVSFDAAVASLVFLVVVHKLEYFVNARIVGNRIDARAWEIIIVMAGMESIFGLAGIIVAPILYAYLKRELRAAGLIGRHGEQDGMTGPSGPQSARQSTRARVLLKEREMECR
ncbi:AI-2E family transporter [Paraburkholderia sp. SIMBA_054]|uniref:AI-2E family transporter n=1 Tax=Paraburkholderia sp. SIMBA_054 TaxID=3085795 RepID=UPI0039792230